MYTDIRFRYPSPCGQYACMGIDRYSEKKTSLSILLYPTPSHLPPHVTLSRGPPPGPLRPLRLPKPRCVSIKWSSRVLTSPAAATLPSRAFSYIIQYLLKLLIAPPPPAPHPSPFPSRNRPEGFPRLPRPPSWTWAQMQEWGRGRGPSLEILLFDFLTFEVLCCKGLVRSTCGCCGKAATELLL